MYPAIAEVKAELFGICVAESTGEIHTVGDATHEFTMMSVAKAFVFALVCEELGPAEARARIGANATGQAFDSLEAIERSESGRTNPMVNSGAIVTASLVPGRNAEERWDFIVDGLSRFAARSLRLNQDVYQSASASNHTNRAMASLLRGQGHLEGDPLEALDLYTRQCSLDVTARDLAVMGATLADGGRNPVSGNDVVSPSVCHDTLAVMATAGMYESSGDWLCEVGVPGKSGVSGGMVTVSPGKGGLGTFSPPIDRFGNSVRGQLTARLLAQTLGMDLFISRRDAGRPDEQAS